MGTKTLTKPPAGKEPKLKTRMMVVDTPSNDTSYDGFVIGLDNTFRNNLLAGKFPARVGPAPEHLKIITVRSEPSNLTKGVSGNQVVSIYYRPTKTGFDYTSSFMQMPLNCGAIFAYGIDGNPYMEAFHFVAKLVLHYSGNKVMALSCSDAAAQKLIPLGWRGLETWSARYRNKKMHYLVYNMKEAERMESSQPYA